MGSSKESNEGGFWSEVNSDIGPMKAASQNDSMEQNNADGAANHQESDKEAMANISSLNTAWKDKVPDDFIQFRDTIDGAKILYIFCTGLYLLMTNRNRGPPSLRGFTTNEASTMVSTGDDSRVLPPRNLRCVIANRGIRCST